MLKKGVKYPKNVYMYPARIISDHFNDVVTSGSEGNKKDGVHRPNSLHYDGLAIDIRPDKQWPEEQIEDYVMVGYNVLNEGDHLHVSFDPEGLRK